MRNKVIAIYQSGKGYRAHLRLWDSSEPLSTNGENLRAVVNLLVSGLPKHSNISVHYSTIRQGSGKKSMGAFLVETAQKEHKASSHIWQKPSWRSKRLMGKFFWGIRHKLIFWKVLSCYRWHNTSTAFHKKNIIETAKHGSGPAASGPEWLTDGTMNFNIWKKFLVECPTFSLSPEAQAHLGYAAGQWHEKHLQVYRWMVKNKPK